MSSKSIFRCIGISVILALITPPVIGFLISISDHELYMEWLSGLVSRGESWSAYFLAALGCFIALIIATLLVQAFCPKKVDITGLEDDDREVGMVKWFNVNKGYGFITRDGGEDVFVHFRAIRGKGHRTLVEGQRVRYYAVENERGVQAEDVTVIT